MSKQKFIANSLFDNGPIIQVKLKSTFRNEKIDFVNNIPERFVMINAFIDTGATCSVIDCSILEENIEMELTQHVAKMNFVNALKQELPVYKVGLDLLNNDFCRDAFVCVMDMSAYNAEIKMLIGRDILSKCIFSYNGIDNTFTLDQKH